MKISYSKLSVFLSNNELSETFRKNLHNAYESLQNIEMINKKLIISNNLDSLISILLTEDFSTTEQLKQEFSTLSSWLIFFDELTDDIDLSSRMIEAFLSEKNYFFVFNEIFDEVETFRKFIKEIFFIHKEIKILSDFEMRYLIQISVFYSLFHKDFNIQLSSIHKFQNENLNVFEIFDDLFVKKEKPVLLTDNFHNLNSFGELRLLADILLDIEVLKNPILDSKISEQEFTLFISQNHPVVNIDNNVFDSLISLIKSLHQVKLNQNLIYRLFQLNYHLSDSIITEINNYIISINNQPNLTELQKFIDFTVSRPYRNLFGEKTRYLFKKELSVLFKDDFSLFADFCEHENCKSNYNLTYIEWIDNNLNKHRTICKNCLDKINFEYFCKYEAPF